MKNPSAANISLEPLAALFGPERLRTDDQARERFRIDGATPAAVAEPADARELTEIVRWARAHRTALLPVTSGCYLPVGNPPAAAHLAVSLARFNRVVHYDPADLTLSVQAGTPLSQIKALLQERALFLPADPPYLADGAAVGGLLAANASGPLRHAYGTWRDFVLGTQCVTGYGAFVKSGGRVVKNVAGYDLSKLLIGSLGTLGILTEISFKVFPLPPRTATFVAGFDRLDAALAFRSRIVHSVLQPMTLDLLDASAARLAGPATGGAGFPQLAGHEWLLVVTAGGVDKLIERYAKELGAFARAAGAASFAQFTLQDEEAVREALRELPARARRAHPGATIVKVTLPVAQVGPFLDKARQVASRYQLPAAASAHAGSGIVHFYLLPEVGKDSAARSLAQAATEMIHTGNNLGGRTTLPWCPTEVKRDVNPWGPIRDDFPLMQKLKAQFDPDRVLNPGRFLGAL